MKNKLIILVFLFIAICSLSASSQCTWYYNGGYSNQTLFTVAFSSDANYLTVTKPPQSTGSYMVRIDYYIGNNYYSEVVPFNTSFYVGSIDSFTLSTTYPGIVWDPINHTFVIGYWYDTKMYVK